MLLVANSRNAIKWHWETAEKEILLWTDEGGLTLAEHSVSVQFSCSVMSDSLWNHTLLHARPPCPSLSDGVYSLMSIESVMPSNHPILSHWFLLLPSIFPSIRVFSNESVLLIGWPKYLRFSFSISPSNEDSGLISFMIDWFELLGVQWILKSLL